MPKPSYFRMIRAPFLSSILAPLLAGTLLAVIATGSFHLPGFVLILIIGIALHTSVNVYNDIYDTIQGTDKINVHRNQFSGGSGVLLDFPELMPRMFAIARWNLIAAFVATIGLTFFVRRELWPLLWGLYLVSAFLSKYYTAAPIKMAYRGMGELFVWFAFGPMAILLAAVGQNVGFHAYIIAGMAVTGLSTLSILLIGQLIDLSADAATGKLGLAARRGTKVTHWVYFTAQLLIVLNIAIVALFIIENGWPVFAAIVPYILIFPKAWKTIHSHYCEPDRLKPAAGMNVQIHLLFSIGLIVGLGLVLII